MARRRLLLLALLGLVVAAVITAYHATKPKPQTVIYIQPLGEVPNDYLTFLQQSVTRFYGYQCVVKPAVPLTPDLLAASQTRYEASKILHQFNSTQNLLLITTKDIAHRKSATQPEYGIFGLGYRPGTTCVVSTFRLHRKVSRTQCLERLEKVALHELGHNLGLPHCTHDKHCMMQAAQGTIKQVDLEKVWFCGKCRGKIR
jgi:archaemetzincin